MTFDQNGMSASRFQLMRIEIVVPGVQRECAIDLKQSLGILVRFFDKPEIHLPDAGLGDVERGAEFGVAHQALSAIVSGLVAGGGLSGRFARQLEGERGHAVGRAGIAVAPIAQSNLVRSSNIEIVAAFAEDIHSLLWHGLWQVSVSVCGAFALQPDTEQFGFTFGFFFFNATRVRSRQDGNPLIGR